MLRCANNSLRSKYFCKIQTHTVILVTMQMPVLGLKNDHSFRQASLHVPAV